MEGTKIDHVENSSTTEFVFDVICVGFGVGAGYFLHTLLSTATKETGSFTSKIKVAVISNEGENVYPYERPALSKGALIPKNDFLRDPNNPNFPFTMKGVGDKSLDKSFYESDENQDRLKIFFESEVIDINPSMNSIEIKQAHVNGSIWLRYEKLVLSTGLSAKCLEPPVFDKKDKSNEDELSLKRGENSISSSSPLSKVYTLRNLVDCEKLQHAINYKEAIGEPKNKEPILIVGGGYIALEVCAILISCRSDLHIIFIIPGKRLLEQFLPEDISNIYENALLERGVQFVRMARLTSLWDWRDTGDYLTMVANSNESDISRELQIDGPKRFFPRNIINEAIISETQNCIRGVCLKIKVGEEYVENIRLPGRFVVLGLGSSPNTTFLQNRIALDSSGFVPVDARCRSISNLNIYAIGDIACIPLSSQEKKYLDHVQNARDSAKFVALDIIKIFSHRPSEPATIKGTYYDNNTFRSYSPLPYLYSRILHFSWKFYGEYWNKNVKKITLHVNEYRDQISDLFAMVWLAKRTHKVIGIFLEGGDEDLTNKAANIIKNNCCYINRTEQKKKENKTILVLPKYIQKLKRDGIVQFLNYPYEYDDNLLRENLAANNQMNYCTHESEFSAEEYKGNDGLTHETESILAVLRKYDYKKLGSIAVEDLDDVFKDLGGTFGTLEILEAKKSFQSNMKKAHNDSHGNVKGNDSEPGQIPYESIVNWWNR